MRLFGNTNERRAIAMMSNQVPEEWGEIFTNPRLVLAALESPILYPLMK